MKISRTAYAMGRIDDELITAAAGSREGSKSKNHLKKRLWLRWGAAAASVLVLAVAGAVLLPHIQGKGSQGISGSQGTGKYKYHISEKEMDIVWPWEYLTFSEKFRMVTYDGRDYGIKSAGAIDTDLLGGSLGICEAKGQDWIDGTSYTETLDIRRINGVSEAKFVAAGKDGDYYVYMLDSMTEPATFGEVLDSCGLGQNLTFDYFTVCEGYDEKDCFRLRDDDYIREVLSDCRDAKLCDEEVFDRSRRNYLSFSVTSKALGVYQKAVYISEDGYFATNIFEYGCTYFIGEDAAANIIDYAKSNSDAAQLSPYALTVAGTLTEIGDGYVMIDDTVLCADAKDGCVYKVYIDDLRIRRCIEFMNIGVGSTVVVKYDGTISEDNEVDGAYSMNVGEIAEGGIAVAE